MKIKVLYLIILLGLGHFHCQCQNPPDVQVKPKSINAKGGKTLRDYSTQYKISIDDLAKWNDIPNIEDKLPKGTIIWLVPKDLRETPKAVFPPSKEGKGKDLQSLPDSIFVKDERYISDFLERFDISDTNVILSLNHLRPGNLLTLNQKVFFKKSIIPKLNGDLATVIEEDEWDTSFVINKAIPNLRKIKFRKVEFITFSFKPGEFSVGLFNFRPGGEQVHTFGTIKEEVKGDIKFIMNAGMFHKGGDPVGLYISNAVESTPLNTKTTGEGNFYMQLNGVFYIDSPGQKANVVSTQEMDNYLKSKHSKVLIATQSGPLLLYNGVINSNFTNGSSNKYVRNGIGVDTSGQIVMVISMSPVNFYDLSSLFLSRLHCKNALYLDGAVSQYYTPYVHKTVPNLSAPLGTYIAVFQKKNFALKNNLKDDRAPKLKKAIKS